MHVLSISEFRVVLSKKCLPCLFTFSTAANRRASIAFFLWEAERKSIGKRCVLAFYLHSSLREYWYRERTAMVYVLHIRGKEILHERQISVKTERPWDRKCTCSDKSKIVDRKCSISPIFFSLSVSMRCPLGPSLSVFFSAGQVLPFSFLWETEERERANVMNGSCGAIAPHLREAPVWPSLFPTHNRTRGKKGKNVRHHHFFSSHTPFPEKPIGSAKILTTREILLFNRE